jgi:hypothetical protein
MVVAQSRKRHKPVGDEGTDDRDSLDLAISPPPF